MAGPADGGNVQPGGSVMRARARQRNVRAAVVSLGLVAFACVCLALVVTGFANVGASRAKGPVQVLAATTTTEDLPPPPTLLPATTTTTTTTIAPTTTSTSSTTTTTTVPVTVPPPPPPTTLPKTTTTVRRVTATATASNDPSFCTVTVRLSTGASKAYPLDQYVSNPGDTYDFTASVGGYKVDVHVRVAGRGGARHCIASASNVRR